MDDIMVTPKTPITERPWFKYGWMSGVLTILISLAIYLIDDDGSLFMNPWIGYTNILIIFVAGILAAMEVKRRQNGILTFAQGVSNSELTFVFAMLISTVFTIILFFVIDPDLLTRMMDSQMEAMQQRVDEGKMTEAQMDAAISMTEDKGSMFFLFGALGGVVLYAILALILYLITSAVIRREPQV